VRRIAKGRARHLGGEAGWFHHKYIAAKMIERTLGRVADE
jgi:hypothetical protein